MAAQLRSAEQQNQRLNEQLSTVQEEERAEIARDLHDEIGPFLFAADVDAQSIPLLLSRDAADDAAGSRSKAIRQSVQHMQLQLCGNRSGSDQQTPNRSRLNARGRAVVAFWVQRRPQINIQTDIEDGALPGGIEETGFRILQEGISNAIRHGNPSNHRIDGSADK